MRLWNKGFSLAEVSRIPCWSLRTASFVLSFDWLPVPYMVASLSWDPMFQTLSFQLGETKYTLVYIQMSKENKKTETAVLCQQHGEMQPCSLDPQLLWDSMASLLLTPPRPAALQPWRQPAMKAHCTDSPSSYSHPIGS